MITLEYLVSGFVLIGREAQLLLVTAFMKVYSGHTKGTGCVPNWDKSHDQTSEKPVLHRDAVIRRQNSQNTLECVKSMKTRL